MVEEEERLQVPVRTDQKVVALDVAVHDRRLAAVQVHHACSGLPQQCHTSRITRITTNKIERHLSCKFEAAAPRQEGGISLSSTQHVPQAAPLHKSKKDVSRATQQGDDDRVQQ